MTGPQPPGQFLGPRFLTIAEVAARLRVSNMTVYRMVHAGELRAVRVRRSMRVPIPALEAYLRNAGAQQQ